MDQPRALLRKIVYLDLEDTVMDDFSKREAAKAMNHARVAQFLRAEAPSEVRIFSFAISSAQHIHVFDELYKTWLEQGLGTRITTGPEMFTTRRLFELCAEKGTFYDTEEECMLFHGKVLAFLQYIRMKEEFVDCEVVLVDDAVGEPMSVSLPKRNVFLRLVNVESLPEAPNRRS